MSFEDLIEILRCPESMQTLTLAQPELLREINEAIAEGDLSDISGNTIRVPIEQALVREDERRAYLVRDDRPNLIAQHALALPLKKDH